MSKYIYSYTSTFITMIILDYVWLDIIAKPLYKNELGSMLINKPNLGFAAMFYVVYVFGLVYFVIKPNVNDVGILRTLIVGALFGLIVYASYDLTNLSLLKGWTIKISIIDICWGTIVSAISVTAGKLAIN
jgi:uncharacterized membrane protein